MPNVKLSILIPTYNWDVVPLVDRLLCELERQEAAYTVDVLVMDDCSSDVELERANRERIAFLNRPYLRYVRLSENIGRARIRNLMVKESSGEYLLFLDSDVLPGDELFVSRYLKAIDEGKCDVYCGGINYKGVVPRDGESRFHLYLSSRNDVIPADRKNSSPWRYVHTANILARRDVLEDLPFDENFTGYGYEDCEWGIRVINKYRLIHIDNEVAHLGLVSRRKIYARMRESIVNYNSLMKSHPEYFKSSPLSNFIRSFSRLHIMVLKGMDHLLKILFNADLGNMVSYYVFQLNKLVLMAILTKECSRNNVVLPKESGA